jgi:ketosteroid isomerase-like protein
LASESPQEAAVRRFVDLFNRGELEALLAEIDAETVLNEWPTAPGAQSYKGPDEIRRAFENWFESWEWMRIEVEDLEEAGDRVIATFHQRARGKGSEAEVEVRSFNVWSFKEGRIRDISLFTDRAPAVEEFRR